MKKIVLTLAVLAMLFASCTQENITEPQPEARTVRVSATIPSTTETRTTFYDGTWDNTHGYGFKVKWAVGDKFSILCWQGDDATHWGDLISTKNNTGNVTEAKGEILYTLQAEDISPDGRTVNFNFNIPTQLTDHSQPVKVLVTYLGSNRYEVSTNSNPNYGGKPWLDLQLNYIREASDFENLLYVTRAMPMTLRGAIAAGWDAGAPQAVFDAQFKHLAALFAVHLRNNTGSAINPAYLKIGTSDGVLMNNGYPYWNPITQEVPIKENSHSELGLNESASNSIASGASFVYFIPTYIKTAPTQLRVVYKGKETNYLSSPYKTNNTLQPTAGKCYTLNVALNSATELVWDTTPTGPAPMQ